jgi:hypothetical protein
MPANQGSKGNPAGSVVSPGMALVASKQGDGSVHVLSPLKFKLGVTWFHFMMVMYCIYYKLIKLRPLSNYKLKTI